MPADIGRLECALAEPGRDEPVDPRRDDCAEPVRKVTLLAVAVADLPPPLLFEAAMLRPLPREPPEPGRPVDRPELGRPPERALSGRGDIVTAPIVSEKAYGDLSAPGKALVAPANGASPPPKMDALLALGSGLYRSGLALAALNVCRN